MASGVQWHLALVKFFSGKLMPEIPKGERHRNFCLGCKAEGTFRTGPLCWGIAVRLCEGDQPISVIPGNYSTPPHTCAHINWTRSHRHSPQPFKDQGQRHPLPQGF